MLEEQFGPRNYWICALKGDLKALELLGSCYGEVNGHELKKRSQGGSITDPDNIVLLCSAHNVAVEDFPNAAHELGLVRRHGE